MSAMPNRPNLPNQASLFDAEPGVEPATASEIPTAEAPQPGAEAAGTFFGSIRFVP